MTDDKLSEWRKQIDAIDNQILQLLAKRIAVVKKVGQYKLKNKIPFFDPIRKEEIIHNKTDQGIKLSLPVDLIKKIYETIHDYSLQIEENLKK